ncbi:MAG TPA: ABC transporter permease [Cyclobacteriaceae bacterium]
MKEEIKSTPPKAALRLLSWFCPEQLYEEIEGDLIQHFIKDVKVVGERKARRRLLLNVIRFFRPGIVLRNKVSIQLTQWDMLIHFIKVFLRTSLKRGSYSFITLSGLVLGMTAFALISLYVLNEQSFDNFHVKKDRIFRLRQDRYSHGTLTRQWTAGPWGIGVELKRDFSEVIRYASVNRGGLKSTVLSNGDVFFREENVFYASEDFFELFSFPLIKGVDSLVLKRPFTMVLSESLARRYFGETDPIGKTLKNNGKEEYEITGVFKDVPANTHLKFDALFSFESLLKIVGPVETEDLMSSWAWAGNYTYIELSKSVDFKAFEAKLPAYVDKEAGAILKSWDESMAFILQPVPSIHLNSNYKDELEPNGDARSIQLLTLVALFILIMAWVNYINLATARAMERAREVGVRKVLGSNRSQLIRQFLMESLFMKAIALCFTITLVYLLLPYFSDFVNRKMESASFLRKEILLSITAIFIFGVIVSGLYPALVLSGFRPVSVLKGKLKASIQGVILRKGLVTFQFVTSIALLIITFSVYRQIQFMRNSSLGIDTEQILVVQGPHIRATDYKNRFDTFKNSLLAQSNIASVSVSSDVPGHAVGSSNGGIRLEGQEMSKGNSYRVTMVDEDYKATYGLQLLTGRWFSKEFNDHWKTALVNETAMHLLGFNDPEQIIGKRIYVWDGVLQIVGVVKDYHNESLKKKVDQLIFLYDRDVSDYYSVKIKPGQPLNEAAAQITRRYQAAFPGNPVHSFFLDDYYNQQYQSDRQFGKVFGLFTLMAIVIACLGLFGLSSYLVVQRTKEIGIRKVMGASVRQISLLVSKEFTLVVVLAIIVSWPLSYWVVNNWLSDFAYRIEIGWVLFIVPAICVFVIAVITVATQSIKAATVNPVDSLRTE